MDGATPIVLPLFALLLKLLYIRRRIYFVEHLVFSLHFHTFLFFCMIVLTLFEQTYVEMAALLALLFLAIAMI